MKILLALFLLFPTLSFTLDKNEVLKKFNSYTNEYIQAFKTCSSTIRKSVTAGMDLQNCIWDKDQILLYRFDLDHILYESSYNRYSRLFNLHKSFATERSNDFDGLAKQEVYLINDSFDLQEIIVLKYYGY